MKKNKTQKGITLVALIITIVVLLILAVVAISSIQNDGIISYAQNATKDYNNAQANEQGTLENYINQMDKYNPTGEKLTEEEKTELELMESYVLGAEKTGRLVTEVVNLDTSTMQVTSFIDNTDTTENESETITPLFTAFGENSTIAHAYAKYNNKVYKIVADYTTYITKDVEVVYKPSGREGTKVAYDSDGDGTKEDWIIITDRDGKVEIVSANVMGSLTLGGTDTEIKNNLIKYLDLNKNGIPDDLDGDGVIEEGGTDLDGDGTTEVDYQDIAIASYNNAITRINEYCDEIVTATDNKGVRSIGGTNNSSTPYSSTNYDNWGSKITVDAASGDIQYEEDLAKMYYYGIANIGSNYWTASRLVYEDSSYVDFSVRYVNSDGVFGNYSLWGVFSGGYVYYDSPGFAVRPVVINPSGI